MAATPAVDSAREADGSLTYCQEACAGLLNRGAAWRILRAARRGHDLRHTAECGVDRRCASRRWHHCAAGGDARRAANSARDDSRGKALVESNGCFDCHRIDQRGSRVGPDLSDIGTRRTPDRLQQALLDPDAEVLFENRFVRFVTKDGATVTGRLLNQDALSVQLITRKKSSRRTCARPSATTPSSTKD